MLLAIQITAIFVFVAVMLLYRFLMVGINADFGLGFALGATVGVFVALLAVRRGGTI